MKDEFNEIDMDHLKRIIQDYVRAVLSNSFQSQIVDQNALVLEFMSYVSEFLERKKEYGDQIVKDERSYQELLQNYETLQKEVKEHRESRLESMKQMLDEMLKGLKKMHQRHMKLYGKAYGDVQKGMLQKFERLQDKQQEELAEFKKKIFSMFM